MDWKSSLILSVGAIVTALVIKVMPLGDGPYAGAGATALATTTGIGFSVYHAVGDKVRYCVVNDQSTLECTAWK